MARLKSISDEASTIVFLFLINKFFKEGSKAARDAVDTFKELGVGGFYIGGNYFSGRNDKVEQGELISQKLLDSIQDQQIRETIINTNYIWEIIDKYRNKIYNG